MTDTVPSSLQKNDGIKILGKIHIYTLCLKNI